jgi:hypothetical protein
MKTDVKPTLGSVIKEQGRSYRWFVQELAKKGIVYHYHHFVTNIMPCKMKPNKSEEFFSVTAEILGVEQSKIEELWNQE